MGLTSSPTVGAVVVFAVLAYYLLTVWHPGKYALDMKRTDMLAKFDGYYKGADSWDAGAQPPSDATNNREAAERYFTLTTDFLEYGWGDAFHMAPVRKGWSFLRSMGFWEQVFALHMGIKKDMKVADLGMGIGGPARRLVEFTGAYITGLTNCKYQLARARTVTKTLPQWVQDRVGYVEGDYNFLPDDFAENGYDMAYFMESLSHAEDRSVPLTQAAKIVKPGGIVGAWQWMLTPDFDYSNEHHLELKRGMEYGGGLRNLNKPVERLEEFKKAGLEVYESWEMGAEGIDRGHDGWWVPLTHGHDFGTKLTSSHIGRRLTMITVYFLETIGVAEKGTYSTAKMMEHCGYCSAKAGELGIFTPMWVMLARVPEAPASE